jgi:hypothetical protein
MATKKHNIIVISVCAVIAVAISFIQWKKRDQPQAESRVYRVMNGWGYDILVNGHVLIHQESIPVIASLRPFETKEEAEATAKLVVKKLNAGQLPSLTKTDLETILPVHELENDQYEKHQ